MKVQFHMDALVELEEDGLAAYLKQLKWRDGLRFSENALRRCGLTTCITETTSEYGTEHVVARLTVAPESP